MTTTSPQGHRCGLIVQHAPRRLFLQAQPLARLRPPHLDEDYLVLSTVHSAKGLEWSAVHVIGAYDGNFPACMSAGRRVASKYRCV